MATNFLYTDLQAAVKGRIHGNTALLTDERVTLNSGVRDCLEIDFRSTKRRSTLSPDLFNEVWQYYCPTDLKGKKIVGLQPQTMERDRHQSWSLVPEENFDQLKQTRYDMISVSDRDMLRKLLISAKVSDQTLIVNSLDSLTSNGTWTAFGDGTNLQLDTYNYIKGSASVEYDISAAGGTTAGIQASDISTFDLTDYASNGSCFVWTYITSATNITNFILRLGNNSSNYYSMTATTANDGTAFVAGWNLLRFDFSGKATTGTITATTCQYAVVYMTKAAGKISETSYRFDHIILKLGQIYNLIYYSKFLWQNSVGTWIAKCTADTDYLNLDTEEFEIVVEKCTQKAAGEVREYETDSDRARINYELKKKEYRKNYKSEALPETSDYYYFNS